MRESRFSDEQIVAILRESDRTSVAEAAKKHKVSEQTIYVWRKHFAGLAPADVKRLKALELENAKLKLSHAILQWLTDARIETAIIDPGKPWQNCTNESFNGKFRDECLSVEWFRTRREAQVIIEAWRRHFNAVRPHSSLAYLTPHEFKPHHPIPFIPTEPFPRIDWLEEAESGQSVR